MDINRAWRLETKQPFPWWLSSVPFQKRWYEPNLSLKNVQMHSNSSKTKINTCILMLPIVIFKKLVTFYQDVNNGASFQLTCSEELCRTFTLVSENGFSAMVLDVFFLYCFHIQYIFKIQSTIILSQLHVKHTNTCSAGCNLDGWGIQLLHFEDTDLPFSFINWFS